jgi:hypothetical protein
MPRALVDAIDRLDRAGRRQALRVLGRAAESSGFQAACEAEGRVLAGGRVPDEASCDMLARRIAAGGGEGAAGPDLTVCDGSLGGGRPEMAAAGELAGRVVAAGRRCSLTRSVLPEWAGRGTPRQAGHLAAHLEAECEGRAASKRANLPGRCAPKKVSTASAPPCAPALPRREARICETRAVINLNLPRFR